MIEVLVCGGQTGVDQGALCIAKRHGIAVGGWVPLGGNDEDNHCILDEYPEMREATTDDPDERTKLNVRDSDGTLIIVPTLPLPEHIRDGTLLTINETQAPGQEKPYLIIALDDTDDAVSRIETWIEENNIRTLNVGGPRESTCPGIFAQTCELLDTVFSSLTHTPPSPR